MIKDGEINQKDITHVTLQHLKNYLLDVYRQRGDLNCPCCKSNIWTFHPSPEDPEKANIVTLPMPLSKGLGMWAFPVTCSSCGFMILLEAAKIFRDLHAAGEI